MGRTAELLSSLEKGLAHLHFHGFAHGCVSPQTVGAVGYSVQLSTECVRRLNHKPIVPIIKPSFLAPESVAENVTTQADVWCLGATLFEALSQKRYGSAGTASFESLPLGAVVKRCLESDPRLRCTLKEAEAKAQQGPEPLLSFGASPVAKPEPLVIPPPPSAGRQSPTAKPEIRPRQQWWIFRSLSRPEQFRISPRLQMRSSGRKPPRPQECCRS